MMIDWPHLRKIQSAIKESVVALFQFVDSIFKSAGPLTMKHSNRPFVTALQRLSHDLDISYTFECEVKSAVADFNEFLHDFLIVHVFIDLFGVDAFVRAHLACEIELVGVRVNHHDLLRLVQYRSLTHCQTQTPGAEDADRRTGPNVGGDLSGTDTGCHTCAL